MWNISTIIQEMELGQLFQQYFTKLAHKMLMESPLVFWLSKVLEGRLVILIRGLYQKFLMLLQILNYVFIRCQSQVTEISSLERNRNEGLWTHVNMKWSISLSLRFNTRMGSVSDCIPMIFLMSPSLKMRGASMWFWWTEPLMKTILLLVSPVRKVFILAMLCLLMKLSVFIKTIGWFMLIFSSFMG